MKLSQLIELLNKAHAQAGPDAEVLLCYEEGAMSEGYEEKNTEGISDIRLVNDWPLPGKSLITYEGEIQQKVVIFYDNHYKLEPSDGIPKETAAQAKKPELAVGQVWKTKDGSLTTIKSHKLSGGVPVFGATRFVYREDGKAYTNFPEEHIERAELIELVSQAPSA